MIVHLVKQDEELAHEVAIQRIARNRHAGNAQGLPPLPQEQSAHELLGVRAEIAVRRTLKSPVSFEVLCLEVPDVGWDIEVAGYKIDVKSSQYASAHLMFRGIRYFKADMAVLVCVDSEALRIAGIISRTKFLKEYEWWESPHQGKPIPIVKQDKLSSILKLINLIEERADDTLQSVRS